MRRETTTTTAQCQGQTAGEGWSEYGRRAMLFALQLDAPCFAGIDNDGLQAGADACNHAMAARGVSDTTVACLTALQSEMRTRLAGRRLDVATRLAGLHTEPQTLPEVPQAATPDAGGPQGPGGGSKVKAPRGPQRPTPPAFQLPQLDVVNGF